MWGGGELIRAFCQLDQWSAGTTPAKARFVAGMDWARTVTQRERSKIHTPANCLVEPSWRDSDIIQHYCAGSRVARFNELFVVGQYSSASMFDPANS